MADEERLIVIATREHCVFCGQFGPAGPRATVVSAKVVDASWVISGRLELHGSPCPRCAAWMAAIVQDIPIQCDTFTCPECRTAEHLAYRVTQIDSDALRFTATIKCGKCGRKRTLRKVLTKLLSVLKISVGPLGISATGSAEKNED
jgi:hypothetical protein